MAMQSKPGPRLAVEAGAEAVTVTGASLSGGTVPAVGDLFDVERLLPELILALGLALLIGNGLAWWKHRRGEAPGGVTDARYRTGRVRWMLAVGVLLTVWGTVSLIE
jgi:hypothetical protein